MAPERGAKFGYVRIGVAAAMLSLSYCTKNPEPASAVAPTDAPPVVHRECPADRFKAGDKAPTTLQWPDRIIRRGSDEAYILNYSPDRLNIEVDKQGRILRAFCG